MAAAGFRARITSWWKYDLLGLAPPQDEAGSEEDPHEAAVARARAAVAERRALLDAIGAGLNEKEVPFASMGLAFSGGGIRSATISLGVAQALARHERLLDFDYCSTVSGGGYFGSFLGSLYLPQAARGTAASVTTSTAGEAKAKADFAYRALTTSVRSVQIEFRGDKERFDARNPCWWLREHSRYLAPNGTSDYLNAVTYMIRNWLAMIYVFALPIAVASLFLIAAMLLMTLAAPASPAHGLTAASLRDLLVVGSAASPWMLSLLVIPAMFLLFLAYAASVTYWMTEYMSLGASRLRQRFANYDNFWARPVIHLIWSSRSRFSRTLILSQVACIAGFFIAMRYTPAALFNLLALPPSDWGTLATAIAFGQALVFAAFIIGIGVYIHAWRRDLDGDAYTAEVRRILTHITARCFRLALILLAAAIVDTMALALYRWLIPPHAVGHSILNSLWATIVPISAWIINRLSGWFNGDQAQGQGQSPFRRFLSAQLTNIALVIGLVMFGLLAVLSHIFVQFVLFEGQDWLFHPLAAPVSQRICFVGAVLGILLLITGWSTGFINLSSLHNIYASRLTRAYLGASNLSRLRKSAAVDSDSKITESDPDDQIPVEIYSQSRSIAPLHLINVTLNETKSRDKSQLVERDRKGVPIVFAPEGVFVDAGRKMTGEQYFSWDRLKHCGVESLSVGQLCAISGAAASSAMGARTTMGGALMLTFANIRLGYWWAVDDLIRGRVGITNKFGTWLRYRTSRVFRTYWYLFSEMTANYSRDYGRLNISDGGHFENSGAYELLRRNVRTILVCDNGADAGFAFQDLELLVRKARIDLGLSINVARASHVETLFGKRGAALFLNGGDEEWRERIRPRDATTRAPSPNDEAYCLLLNVYKDADGNGTPVLSGHMVWMKPRLFCGLPQDVVGYALSHHDFPHETTGDQFFDEAQWESYRALGYSMTHSLLSKTFHKQNCLRRLNSAIPG